jgi:hypothetical protein
MCELQERGRRQQGGRDGERIIISKSIKQLYLYKL